MLIAVLSDSHDRLDSIEWALTQIHIRGVTNAIHLGDFCAPFSLLPIAKSGIKFTAVWGNNDGDKLGCYRTIESFGTVDVANGDYREIEYAGRTLFLTHYPDIARLAALSGQYDTVLYGHNHRMSQEIVTVGEKSVLLANPGELCGIRFGIASFAIYDTEKQSFEFIK